VVSPYGNFYQATANRWHPSSQAPDTTKIDVAVIGGGFTGLSAALACAERGYSVSLYEAEHIGFGASGRNGGQLIPGLRWNASKLWEYLGPDVATQLFNLCWRDDRVLKNVERYKIECSIKSGFFEAAWRSSHFAEMEREAEFLDKHFAYETEVVQPLSSSTHVCSDQYAGGLFDPQGGHFHPLNYALGLAKAAQDAGVRLHEHERVRPDQLHAHSIIVATDSWIGETMPRFRSNSVSIMNYNVATAPLPDPSVVLPSDAAVADSRFVLNYYRLSADGRLIFGGGERYSSRPPADIAAYVRPYMEKIFPQLSGHPIEYAWGGPVDVTLNRLPHVGRDGNIFYAHGFSGHGAMVTSLIGECIAEAICGSPETFDLFANLPHKAFPGGAYLSQSLAVLGMFYYALRDRLG
jgi:gamma-glutamylputrescine oxidase